MDNLKQQIIELLNSRLPEEALADEESLTVPPDSKLGDFSYACFNAAKVDGRNPVVLARDLAESLSEKIHYQKGAVSSCQAVGPYLNFFINTAAVAQEVLPLIIKQGKKYGWRKNKSVKTLMVEYSGPNTHKFFHIGHLRNTVLGSALINLYQAQGNKVIAANYINDVGSHVAKILWYLNKQASQGAKVKQSIGDIYVKANKLIKDRPEYEAEVAEVLRNFEKILPPKKPKTATEKKMLQVWEKTKQSSLVDFKRIYKLLAAHFDTYFFEKDVKLQGKKIVAELLKKGIARKSQGAIIVDLEDQKLGVLLILRTNGTGLYATSDLALAKAKFKKYKLDSSIYITDSRQAFYFKQLFEVLRLWGFKKDLVHIPYEFVTVGGKVLASRAGEIVTFDQAYQAVYDLALAETVKRHEVWPKSKCARAAQALTLASLKFEMLKTSPQNVIDFEPAKAVSFEGFTGPYLQYTLARINSIFVKGKVLKLAKADCSLLKSEIERKIVWQLADFSKIVSAAAQENNPAGLAQYLFNLAKSFASFYESQPVLNVEQPKIKEARLYLLGAIRQVMENGMNLLGLPIVKEM